MKIDRIHHVAYRCKDAKQTVEWYVKNLGMDFVLAIAEDQVPSTKAPDPYMHVFLDAGNGNVLAFFELPNAPQMGRDENTPEWVQHLAFKVKTQDELKNYKASLSIVSGPKYDFNLVGKARRPGVKLNQSVFDFGPCFVTGSPTPVKKMLYITNVDK